MTIRSGNDFPLPRAAWAKSIIIETVPLSRKEDPFELYCECTNRLASDVFTRGDPRGSRARDRAMNSAFASANFSGKWIHGKFDRWGNMTA